MKGLLAKMKKLNENKNGRVVTFDFDNTIIKSFPNINDGMHIDYEFGGLNKEIIKRIKKFKDGGATVLVVSSRNVHQEEPESSIDSLLKRLDLDVDGVFYTNGQPKAQKLYELGSTLHYDDDPREHEAIKAYSGLHQNFGITVKYPDDLLSDINEVAKGIIATSDGNFVIVQRSDTGEWDAPGGHLFEGEEPAYAFYREVQEELGLDVTNVQHLQTMDTVWKKKEQLVHYFISSVPYTCEEIGGSIDLQWELSNYYCGSLTTIEEKLSSREGSTQNLKNLIGIMEQSGLLLEREKFQQKMYKNHAKMKKRLIGLGGSKTTGAKGLKRIKIFRRSKSAPAGFGAMGEEKKPKPKRKIKIKIKQKMDEKKRKKTRKKKKATKKYHWNVPGWVYGGGYGDGGADGGGK